MPYRIAKVAVSGVSYTIDHTYSYLIPETLADILCEGMRVLVPFGVSNRRTEAMVLEITSEESRERLKPIIKTLETEPVFDRELIRLALWIRERCFCTFYDAAKAMLPSGIWHSLEDELALSDGIDVETALRLCASESERALIERMGARARVVDMEQIDGFKSACEALITRGLIVRDTAAVRGVGDKHINIYTLAEPQYIEEYIAKVSRRSPQRAEIAAFVRDAGQTGAADGEIIYFTGHPRRTITAMVKAGVLHVEKRRTYRTPDAGKIEPAEKIELNEAQAAAAERLISLSRGGKAAAALLYGVTGSGKTEVYIKLIEAVTNDGKGALVMVPEISLTPQVMRIFRSRFGGRVAILHSALSNGERADEWRRIKVGEANIVLGTRSAVFAPIQKLGVIVIDEEQERSYKSDQSPRYHARDAARRRAASLDALLVLGSATPSVESFYAAQTGRYELLRLDSRYAGRPMPSVEIADMRAELVNGNNSAISSILRSRIVETLNAGHQCILLLNRRGASRRIFCPQCGYMPECPNCSVAMTFHSANWRLMCHYCSASQAVPDVCPQCGGELRFIGVGTQKVEEELSRLFPDAGILRMDSDTTSPRGSHEEILSEFRRGEAQILVGTQMVAKGLDFENVTLVGVISADNSLYSDDYRANERTFSIITQVVGRAGRGETAGTAVIQTYTPDNPIIHAAARQDYDDFYSGDIELRKRFGYPPFATFIAVEVSGGDDGGTRSAALKVREHIRKILLSHSISATILGPAQAPIFRLKGRYRFRIMLCGPDERLLRRTAASSIKQFKSDRSMRYYSIYADINPND